LFLTTSSTSITRKSIIKKRAQLKAKALPAGADFTDSMGKKLKDAFTALADKKYKVAADTVLYHGTPASKPGNGMESKPIWISPDAVQSIAAGRKHRETGARDCFFLWHVKVKSELTLYPLPPCGPAALTALNTFIAESPIVKATTGLFGVTATGSIEGKIVAICDEWDGTYDGWRSPWDQDEIMICPGSKNKLQVIKIQKCPKADFTAASESPAYEAQAMPTDVACSAGDRFSYFCSVTVGATAVPLVGVPSEVQCPVPEGGNTAIEIVEDPESEGEEI